MEQNPNRRRQAFRLLRISLIAFGLLLLTAVLHPQRLLPPDMTLGEFFQAMLGVLMLSGLMAAVVFRAWNDYQRKLREKATATAGAGRGNLTDMLARIQAGEQKEVALLVKADVQGSAEAIGVTVQKLAHEEVRVRVLLSGVGQITESDVQLAKASNAVIVAFNVRATSQARELAQRDGVDIRYFSIIYEVADDVEKLVKGKVAPKAREKFLGYAEVRKVFDITKTGKVAGCMITEGLVKRGAGVRVLRENVVIHSGELSQLKRFKDDVREVARGYECGLSFANFHDLREGDVVECFEVEMVPG